MRAKLLIILITQIIIFPFHGVRGQNCGGYPYGNVDFGVFPESYNVCAPLSASLLIRAKKVFDNGNFNSVGFRVNWGDGTTNDYYYSAGQLTHVGANWYEATVYHTYPPTTTDCDYTTRSYLLINGSECSSVYIDKVFYVWNTDDQGSGHLLLQDQVTSQRIVPICEGEGATITFVDNSIFNCNITASPDNPNLQTRWIQFVYGTSNDGTYAGRFRIPSVSAGGTPVTNSSGNLISGVLYGPIQTIPTPAYASGLLTSPISFPAGVTTNGQVFEVTVRYWNVCNPYDDPDIPGTPADLVNGDHPPVITTALIEIITTPPDLTGVTSSFCIGENLEVTVNPYLSGGIIKWYTTSTPSNLVHTGSTFHPSTDPVNPADRLLNSSAGRKSYWVTETLGSCESDPTEVVVTVRNTLTTPSPITCSKTVNLCPNETGITFSLPVDPATETYGGATEYVWTLPTGLTLVSGQGTKTITVNAGSNAGSYTVSVYRQYATDPRCPASTITLNKTINSLPGATIGPATLSYCSSQSAANPDIDISALSGQTPLQIIYEFTIGATTYTRTLNSISANVNDDNPTPWPGAGTITTYTLKSITDASGCTTTAPNPTKLLGSSTVSVREALTAPTFPLTNPSSVCSGEQNVLFTLGSAPPVNPVGGSTRIRYQEANTSNGDNNWLNWDDGTAGFTDYESDNDQIIDVLTQTSQIIKRLRARLEYTTTVTSNSLCETGYTNRDITVYPLPNVVISGNTTVCSGNSATLTFTVTNGPVNLTYTDGTTSWPLNNVNTTTASTAALLSSKTYTISSVTRATAPACNGTYSGSAIITVNQLPTAGTDDPDKTICQGSNFSFVVDLTGVAGGSFVLGYKINGGATQFSSFNDYAHTLTIPSSSLNIGVNTITLVSINQQVGVSSPCSGNIVPGNESISVTVDQHPTPANAGTDISECNPITTSTLAATAVIVGSGLWSVVSKPVTAPNPTFSDASLNSSNVSITSPNWGAYRLRWTTSNGVCPDSTDDVVVDFGDAPTVVDAGPDASVCLPSYKLQGNTPTIGQGTWSYTGPGSLTFDDIHDPESNITAAIAGTYTLTWTITSGTCPSIQNDVQITFKATPVISTVADITKCPGDASGAINFTATAGATITWNNDNTSIGIGASGSGDISSVTLTNSGVTVNTATITVHGVLSGCNASDVSFDVNVNPRPVVDAIGDITVCPGDIIDVPDFHTNIGSSETFNWTNNQTAISLSASGIDNIADFNGTNTTSSNLTADINVTATLNSCTSNPRTFHITVKPKPVIAPISNAELCRGEIYTPPAFTSTPAGATFSWTNSQTAIGLGASGTGNITSFVANENTSGSNITGVITISAILASCPATNISYNIVLKPRPVLTAISDIQVCPSTNVNQSFSANTGGLETFSWSNSNTNIGLGSSGTENISFTTSANNSGSNRTGTIKVSAVRLSCNSDTISFNITNKPTPAITAVPNFNVCPGESVDPDLVCSPAGTITWTNSQPLIGLAASGSFDISAFNAASNVSGASYTGNISINATLSSCPATPVTFTITVKPKPVVTNILNQSACSGETINPGTFTANTGGGEAFSWTNTNTAIGLGTTGTSNISYTAPANTSGGNYVGNVTVRATLASCQSDPKSFSITIKATPYITPLAEIYVCPQKPVNATFIVSPSQDSVRWRFTDNDSTGTGNIASFNANTNISGSDIIRPVEVFAYANACKSAAMNFDVIVRPTPQMVALTDIVVCPGQNIIPGTFQTNPTGSTFAWTNSEALVGMPLSGTDQIDPWLASNTTSDSIKALISVTPILNTCVGNPETFSIAIKPKPFLNPMTDISVCPGDVITVPAYSTTPSGSIFSWTNSDTRNGLNSSGSGNISSYTAPANTSAGNYTGTITVTANLNGCSGNSVTFNITVKPTPTTSTILGTANVCASTPTSTTTQVYRTDVPSGSPGSTYAWSITSSTPASAAPVNLSQFNNSYLIDFSTQSWTGTIQVVETGFNGCVGAPRTAILHSYDVPVVNAGKDTSVCSGGNITLGGFPTASGGSSSYTYNWSPASGLDDRTKANPVATPSSPVTYSITVTDIISSCVSQPDYVAVDLNALPAAPAALNQAACEGDPTPDLTAVGTDIKWYLDEDRTNHISNDNPFSTGYTSHGTYTYYASQMVSGCESATREVILTINSIPAKPNVSDVTICYGQTVPDLTCPGTAVRWYDDAGLTHIVKNGNVFSTGKTDAGVYTFYVTQTTNDCTSPADTVILTIKPRPAAPLSTDHTVCSNDNIPDLSASGTGVRWYANSFLITAIDSGNAFSTGNTAPGTYTYFTTQTVAGCQSAAKAVTLVIRPVPEIHSAVATDETVCNSGDGKITVIASGTPPLGYSINGGTSFAVSGNFSSLGNGNYPVAIQNNYGCIAHGDTLKISSGNAPVKPIAGTSAVYCQGQALTNLFATPLSGGTITWYKDAALSTPLSNALSYTPDNVTGTTYYYITETYGGCESQSVNVSVTINPLPSAPQINDTIVCTGMGIPTLHAIGSNIYWYSDDLLTQVVNNGNYFVTGAINAGNYTWYLASTNLGCRGPVTDVTLTIQQTPSTPVGTNTTSCAGDPVPALTATGSNIHWYSNSTLTNEVNSGNSFNTGKTDPGDYKYYLIGDDGHCKSNASVVMQTIYAIPAKPIGLDRTICEEQPTPALVASGASVIWYDDAELSNSVEQGSTLNVTYTLPGTYRYYATQTLNSCQSPPDTVVLLIKPKPLKPVAPDVTSCEGTPTPSLKVTTGTDQKWYYLINKVGSGPSYATGKTTPGTWIYGVTQTINGCESDPEDVQLTIYTAPVFSKSDFTDQTACNSNDGTITVYAAGYAPLTYSIDDGTTYQSSNFFNGLKNAFYPVRIKNGYGCTKPGDTITIHDGGAPAAPYAIKDTVYCANNDFEPLEANASVAGTLTWYSDWGLKNILSTGNSITPSLITGSTHYYVTETSGGCESDPTILTVSINLMPVPPVSRDTALCYGLPVPNLTAIGEGIEWFNNPSLTTVIWNGETFATGRRDSGVYVYYVTQLIDGCRSEATIDSLTIYPRPNVAFEPSTDQGCSPLSIDFDNTSSGSIFTWTFGDQTSDNTYSPTHLYTNNTYSQKNYPVKLVANNKFNCSNSLVKFVTIFPFPNYKFSMVPDEGCHPLSVSFQSPSGAQNYDWSFGDYTSLSGKNNNTTNTYENDTYNRDSLYYISLTATSAYGCSDTYLDTLLVHPNPDVSFTTDLQDACDPFTPVITNLSVGATGFRWNFGDNTEESTSTAPTHTYHNTSAFTAPYVISLRAQNNFGCNNTVNQNIRVYPPMDAAFTLGSAGCSPFSTIVSNQSWGSGLSYYWTTSDYQSSGAMNPSFTFNNHGFADSTYTIRLIIQSQQNCFDTAVAEVVVYARPTADFQVTPQELLYPETTFTIAQNTQDSPSGIWQYTWEFGDDSTTHASDPQQHTFDTSGVYTIKLKVDGVFCFDTVSHTVQVVLPPPIAGFDSITPNCSPYSVQFNNNSIYAETFRWAFGDGSFSNKKNPQHEYWDAGTYVVTLTVEGPGGKDSHQGLVTAHPLPKAKFDVEPGFVYVPDQPVKCFNQSENGQIFEWDFGDSSAINFDSIPVHYYQQAGQYNITMWVRTNTEPQCSDSLTKEKAVVADAAGKIKLPNAFRPSQGGANGGHYTPGGYNNNIFYPPVSESVIEYKLIIYNRWGQKMFETKDLKQGWDGYFDGKLCEQGVYVWRVEGKYANKQTFVKMGDVTLLR